MTRAAVSEYPPGPARPHPAEKHALARNARAELRRPYDAHMVMDAQAEYERVCAKYAPAGLVGFASLAVLICASAATGAIRITDWHLMVPAVGGLLVWELTKWRLRRNAHQFAVRSRSAL